MKTFQGTHSIVSIVQEPKTVTIFKIQNLETGVIQEIPSTQIDTGSMQVKTLEEAAQLVSDTGEVKTYQVRNFSGPKGKIIGHFNRKEPNRGYGLFIRKGVKSLRFNFNRLDLQAISANDIPQAFKKILFGTGIIPLYS